MWKNEWDAISTRIAGIVGASEFLFRSGEADQAYSTNVLVENCTQTAEVVLNLLRYGGALPPKASAAIARFKIWWGQTWGRSSPETPRLSGFAAVQASVVLLASVRAELDHLLADHDEIIRSHVTRGFHHLQRSLIVDDDLRAKWLAAFEKGETSCEQMGGVHLLLHGIWAFKASSTGERTDLVLGTRLVVDQDVIASAHGLVLTEWKLVRKGDSPEEKRLTAKRQAALYSERSLAGFELESEKYLVLVGKEEFEVPGDESVGTTKYRVMPLFLNPRSPSVSANDRA